jgi:biopolymer transport protein ExbB/TolQ
MGQCPKCGTTTSPEHSFCLTCGTVLDKAPEAPVGAAGLVATSDAGSPAPAAQAAASRVPPAGPVAAPARGGRDAGRGRRPQPTESVALPAIFALGLTVLAYVALNTVVPAESYIHRLFRPSGSWVMSVVPALILYSFVWTMFDLVMKFRIARLNERDLHRQDVIRIPALVTQEPASTTLQRVRSWDGRILARPVGRRVLWLLQHLDTVDAQRAHELIRHQSDLDADAAASGYRTVRLFIWAMPILGFIGTVLGISLAVGGFSDFLTTNVSIDEIDRVTEELGNVASGLSFAFDTTLLGLLGGLFASVASSGVQAREERLLTRLEELGLRILENSATWPGAAATTSVRVASEPGAEFEEMMRTRLAQLSGQMDQFTKAVRVGLDGFLGEWGKLAPEVERVAADLSGLRQHLASAAAGVDQLILETRVLLEGLREASQNMGTGLEASIGSVTDTVSALGDSLHGVSSSVASSLTALGERVSASETHLADGLTSLQTAIAQSQRDDEATARALQSLSASVTDLAGRLEEFRASQEALVPILKQLSGPLELRLMPSPRG